MTDYLANKRRGVQRQTRRYGYDRNGDRRYAAELYQARVPYDGPYAESRLVIYMPWEPSGTRHDARRAQARTLPSRAEAIAFLDELQRAENQLDVSYTTRADLRRALRALGVTEEELPS